MTTLRIKELSFMSNIGVYPEEKTLGQRFMANINAEINYNNIDNINNSVDYGQISDLVVNKAKDCTFDLIETFAHTVADTCLQKFPLINKIEIEIIKPHAPLKVPFKSVSVSVIKTRETE